MKNMILASTAVGVLVASLIIAFSNRKNKSGNSIKGAAKNAYGMMNEGLGGIERSTARNFS